MQNPRRARVMTRVLFASLALAAGLGGCGRKAGDTPPPVPAEGRSPAAAAVARHLEYGGEFFGVVDVTGALEELGAQYAGLLGRLAQPPGGGAPKVDYAAEFRRLGLQGIEGAGLSSWRKPGDLLYHNRGFLYVPAGRQGLLGVLGGPAGPFAAPALAPTDADLVVEGTLDLRALAELVFAYVHALQGPDAVVALLAELKQPVAPGMPISWLWLIEHGNTRLTFIARADARQTLALGGPLAVPRVDLLIGLDGLADLYSQFEPLLKEGQLSSLFSLAEKNGLKTATWEFSLPAPWADYKPLLVADPKTKRLYVATTPAFADATVFSEGPRLAGAADFRAATAGLPREGNSLVYVSSQGLKTGIQAYQGLFSAMTAGAAPYYNPALLEPYTRLPQGIAAVTANLPDGVLAQSTWPQSNKALLTLGPLAALGLLVGGVAPGLDAWALPLAPPTP